MTRETFISIKRDIRWLPEAAQAVNHVPKKIRQFVRQQIESYARERGLSEINLELVQEARKNLERHVKPQSIAESDLSVKKYRKIYSAIDGSELSNEAMHIAVQIGKKHDAELFGSHVYAAKLHDRRFKAMESGLPEKYQKENELGKQRKIHDSLITKGLELITDSYLNIMSNICLENGLPFTGISLEGRNWQALVKDINTHDYDLITLGAHGIGRVASSLLGTVTERVLRRVRRDILICKKTKTENPSDEIVVCLDGSSRSWGALIRGIQLANTFQKKLTAISAFDPYFHYTMFNLLNGVLTDKAREVFKFEEQEKLHEDIIDSGLAKIYQSHLSIAERIAADENIKLQTNLLDGKVFEKILEFAQKTSPWLLVIGRIGIHSDEEMDIGGNTENICRLAPCNLLIVDTQFKPSVEYQAEATVTWTKEARAKMSKIPAMAQGVATKAIQDYCLAEGYTIVTGPVLEAAIKDLLPTEAIEKMGITFNEKPESEDNFDRIVLSFKCQACGHVHHGSRPQLCPICGKEGAIFSLIESKQVKDGIAVQSMGDRQLIWEKSCVEALEKIENPVLLKQIKAKLEKQALTQRLSTITLQMFSENTGMEHEKDLAKPIWTDAAINRLNRVPEGFMRTAAQNTVEEYAKEKNIVEITLEVAENGLVNARGKMAAAINGGISKGDPHSRADGDITANKLQTTANGSFECSMCSFIVDGKEPNQCLACEGSHFKKLTEAERNAASKTATMLLEWDKEALVRIQRVPAGFMRHMTRCRIEQWARKHFHKRVTLDVVEAKYKSWAEGSEGLQCEMTWSDDARARIEKVPEFIRPMVMREIERNAEVLGKHQICSKVINKVLDNWSNSNAFHKKS
jgi:nucleotide-binding universal stress UspA family protein/rubrerythrin